MTISLVAMLLLAQSTPASDEQKIAPLSSPEARKAIYAFGVCAADNSSKKAAKTLQMDFRTSAYRNSMRIIADTNRGCFRQRRLKSSPLLFAGAMAERLLTKDQTPLNVRLARVALHPVAQPLTPSDQIAFCVAYSAPDDVAALFATPVASPEEQAVERRLDSVVQRCSGADGRISMTDDARRAVIATAAFRAVTVGQAGSGAAIDG